MAQKSCSKPRHLSLGLDVHHSLSMDPQQKLLTVRRMISSIKLLGFLGPHTGVDCIILKRQHGRPQAASVRLSSLSLLLQESAPP